jgi:regulator of sigma E protease
LNLLSIPLLDGGHLAYYAIEAMQGKAMNERAKHFGIDIGVFLLAALMFVATYNDVLHLIRQWTHLE